MRAWVVEFKGWSYPVYLGRDNCGKPGPTPLDLLAVRFCRQQDAKVVSDMIAGNTFVAEHEWLDAKS